MINVVKVMVGSYVFVQRMGKRYRGVIRQIRPRSKMVLVEIDKKKGGTMMVWRHDGEIVTDQVFDSEIPKVKLMR